MFEASARVSPRVAVPFYALNSSVCDPVPGTLASTWCGHTSLHMRSNRKVCGQSHCAFGGMSLMANDVECRRVLFAVSMCSSMTHLCLSFSHFLIG